MFVHFIKTLPLVFIVKSFTKSLLIRLLNEVIIIILTGEEIRARARFWRDQNLLDRANAMPLKSCDALETIAQRG